MFIYANLNEFSCKAFLILQKSAKTCMVLFDVVDMMN